MKYIKTIEEDDTIDVIEEELEENEKLNAEFTFSIDGGEVEKFMAQRMGQKDSAWHFDDIKRLMNQKKVRSRYSLLMW
jgi:hypothetical protein